MLKTLTNKKGFSYIYPCVFVFVASMLLSVIILYMSLIAQVQIQKREVQRKLDGYIAEYSVEMFEALKQGGEYGDYIDLSDFSEGAYRSLGFADSTVNEADYGNGNCMMSRPVITTHTEDSFGITAEYTVTFPIKWSGKTYTYLTVPIKVSSVYKSK